MKLKLTKPDISISGLFLKAQIFIIPLIAAMIALGLGALIIMSRGADPLESYTVLIRGAFGSLNRIGFTVGQTVPLIFTGLAVAIAYQGGVFNLGGQGQLLMGGIGATIIAISFPDMPPVLHIFLAISVSALFGALWAVIPGLMKAKLGITAVITTLMFNYIAEAVIEWVVRGPLQGDQGGVPASALIHKSAELPLLGQSAVSSSVIIALVAIVAAYIFMYKTTVGFRIRSVGFNPSASVYAGIKSPATIMTSILISGGLAGIAGGLEVLSITHRLWDSLLHGYGFTGITVALVGGLHPAGVLIAGIFFGALRSGANSMQVLMKVPVPIIFIIQALTILFVVAGTAIRFHSALGRKENPSEEKAECKEDELVAPNYCNDNGGM